jgi:hypothetical protein
MPCEKYQAGLINRAVGDGQPELPADLQAHLHVCPSCRRFLEEEQLLRAMIDASLRRMANAPVPALFLQRFEARLAQELPLKRSWNASYIYLAAAAAVALLMPPMLRVRSAKEPRSFLRPQTQVAKPAPQTSSPAASPQSARESRPVPRSRKSTTQQSLAASPPEVLVPPEEREAFARFLSSLNGHESLAVALIKPVIAHGDQATEPVQTQEIEIAALAVQPLEERNEK